MKPKRKEKQPRAIIDGRIATIYHGKRLVARYTSGQPLIGHLAQGREYAL